MASFTTNKFRQLLLTKAIDLVNDSGVKVMLVGSGYTPDKDHDFVSSITAGTSKELSGTGYTAGFGGAGRKALAGRVITRSDATDTVFFDATDVTWTAINAGTIAYVALVKEVTSDSDSPLIAILDPTDLVTNGGDVTLQFAATGLVPLT